MKPEAAPGRIGRLNLLLFAGVSLALGPASGGPTGISPVFSNPLLITNPYAPFVPGAVKVFSGVRDRKRSTIVDLFLAGTRTFQLGGADIPTRVLQETEFEDGVTGEISQNFFAQADDGTEYYFGELVDVYEAGVVVGHEGSWLVGGPTQPADPPGAANASVPGVFMPGTPQRGDRFKPEDVAPVADETAVVTALDQTVIVPAGRFRQAIRVRETSSLSPGKEVKWYAPGVGVVKGRSQGELFQLIAATL